MGAVTTGSRRTVQTKRTAPLVIPGLLGAAACVVYLSIILGPRVLVAISTWLHAMATIIWVGYYLFLGLVYLPVLERRLQASALREVLEQVSARLRLYFGASLLIFLVTGTYLMLINDQYRGLGDFFANPWSVLIVAKHVLVLAFLALAVFSERVFMAQIGDQNPEALGRFHWALNINAALGVTVLLLTSIAQVA